MRELGNGTQNFTKVIALDERGSGNANHKYSIVDSNIGLPKIFSNVKFQNGAVKESGVNGCHNEDLIVIVIDRLEGFQSGKFVCEENEMALAKLKEALMFLNSRTQNRIKRGVEGTSVI